MIASQIAIGHPERVNQLVLFGAAFQADAYVDLFTAALNQPALFNAFIDSTFGLKYHLTSPTPDYWPTFRDKLPRSGKVLLFFRPADHNAAPYRQSMPRRWLSRVRENH